MGEKMNAFIKLEHTYKQLPKCFYTEQAPDQVPNPKLIIFNEALAHNLGISEKAFMCKEGIEVLAGNKTLAPSIAQAYAGHQFGYFTMLGDGRAILLGEFIAEDGQRYDLQLKGSGRTAYSRRGDGKAALGPMLREYIISEGMQALGIPTTRSLAVVTTGEEVIREQIEEGAILTRIAKSHIRVGTFQYAAKWGTLNDLKALADYTLERHFEGYEKEANPYLYLLRQVIVRQAKLISKWQMVGFIHGVMNTDNVAISGETIDYGPCAFMDTYDPKTVFSSIDEEGRYAYGNQPMMAAWNMARFAEALLPLIHKEHDEAVNLAKKEVTGFEVKFRSYWQNGMCHKLGISEVQSEDVEMMQQLLGLMIKYKADYTNTFRLLTIGQESALDFSSKEDFKQWKERWKKCLAMQQGGDESTRQLMRAYNPVVIPRNHQVETALRAAVNNHDMNVMRKLLEVISNPYDYEADYSQYISVPQLRSCSYKTYCGT